MGGSDTEGCLRKEAANSISSAASSSSSPGPISACSITSPILTTCVRACVLAWFGGGMKLVVETGDWIFDYGICRIICRITQVEDIPVKKWFRKLYYNTLGNVNDGGRDEMFSEVILY
jgi:hypothetical protein